jgi:DNA-binding NarL/FixJ family response regulator
VENTTERTAVLLDQHPLWLSAIERILLNSGVKPIAKATTSSDAIALVQKHRPDMLVLDVDLNGGAYDGLACLREALARVPGLKVIAVSASSDAQRIDATLSAGAIAYVLKRAEPEDLASAVRQVFSRSLYLAGGEGATRRAPASQAADAVGLTRREREILQLVSEGHTNVQIARTLWVTEQTVKFHLANIFRKVDVTNRTQASRWAHAHGLLSPAGLDEQDAVAQAV